MIPLKFCFNLSSSSTNASFHEQQVRLQFIFGVQWALIPPMEVFSLNGSVFRWLTNLKEVGYLWSSRVIYPLDSYSLFFLSHVNLKAFNILSCWPSVPFRSWKHQHHGAPSICLCFQKCFYLINLLEILFK